MVLYFTGTGNSEFVAKKIAEQLADEVINTNTFIKLGEKQDFASNRPYVFVFPVYLSVMPEILADFIQKCNFTKGQRAYFVATCASEMGATANRCKELCTKKELVYKGTCMVQMPQNYIALFRMTQPDECKRRVEAAKPVCKKIASIIKQDGILKGKVASRLEYASTKLVEKLYNGPFTKTKKFYATDACVSCGLCERVCPLNNIEMQDGKPKWKGSCIHCMGCINRCPKQAIEYGTFTIGKERYVCQNYEK